MHKIVVTLINGTFAEEAEWIQHDSKLSRYLKDRFGDQIELKKFSWNGKNTVRARITSAQKLRTHIKSISQEEKDSREDILQFIIAHSHGGNVAMMACNDKEVERSITGIITLATPFLYFRRSGAAARLNYIGCVSLPLTTLVLLSILPIIIRLLCGCEGWLNERLVSFFVPFFMLMPFAYSFLTINHSSKDHEEVCLPKINPEKILILRSVGDEAGGLLAASSIISWLSIQIYSCSWYIHKKIKQIPLIYYGFILYISLAIGFIVFLIAGWIIKEVGLAPGFIINSIFYRNFNSSITYAAFIALSPLLITGIVGTCSLVLRVMWLLPFGFDVPFGYSDYMITAESTPALGSYQVHMSPSFSELEEEENPSSLGIFGPINWETLKHSDIHSDPIVFDWIKIWILEKIRLADK